MGYSPTPTSRITNHSDEPLHFYSFAHFCIHTGSDVVITSSPMSLIFKSQLDGSASALSWLFRPERCSPWLLWCIIAIHLRATRLKLSVTRVTKNNSDMTTLYTITSTYQHTDPETYCEHYPVPPRPHPVHCVLSSHHQSYQFCQLTTAWSSRQASTDASTNSCPTLPSSTSTLRETWRPCLRERKFSVAMASLYQRGYNRSSNNSATRCYFCTLGCNEYHH